MLRSDASLVFMEALKKAALAFFESCDQSTERVLSMHWGNCGITFVAVFRTAADSGV